MGRIGDGLETMSQNNREYRAPFPSVNAGFYGTAARSLVLPGSVVERPLGSAAALYTRAFLYTSHYIRKKKLYECHLLRYVFEPRSY